ncbi:MAG: hypothetical protein WBY94_11465 [Polyangiaceae bacterium]
MSVTMPTDDTPSRSPSNDPSKASNRKARADPRALASYAALLLVVAFTLVWRRQDPIVSPPTSAPTALSTPITPPPPSAAPSSSALSPTQRIARDLRHRAFIAYEDDRYAETLEYLNKARAVDPDGEKEEKVQAAREYSESQLKKSASGDASAQAAPPK